MEINIQNALCQALINAVGKYYGQYQDDTKWLCPHHDGDEEDEDKCTCKEGLDKYMQMKDDMFACYLAIRKVLDETKK